MTNNRLQRYTLGRWFADKWAGLVNDIGWWSAASLVVAFGGLLTYTVVLWIDVFRRHGILGLSVNVLLFVIVFFGTTLLLRTNWRAILAKKPKHR